MYGGTAVSHLHGRERSAALFLLAFIRPVSHLRVADELVSGLLKGLINRFKYSYS